jgi:glycosyltransferase involved in cell wall biosynthesis
MGGVASVAGWLVEHQAEIGCDYETFDLWRPPLGQLGGTLQLAALPRQVRLLIRYVRWLRRAPDLIHYCVACSIVSIIRDTTFIALARLAGKEVVAHIHGSEFVTARTARYVQKPAMKIVASLTIDRVALTRWGTDALASLGITSRWIVNPITLRGTHTRPPRPEGGVRLLFVGSYGSAKGCDDLVAALARARARGVEASLRFVGKEMYDGEEAELRTQAHRLGAADAVEFVGRKELDALAAEYQNADAICLPSLREVLPLALLEGMSFGLPALATPVGGIPDIIEDGVNGVLVPIGDIEALAAGIELLGSDPQVRLRMGRAARERTLALTAPEQITVAWREVYRLRG